MPPTHLGPAAPVPKRRSLSFAEREEIALEWASGTGVRAITVKLSRSPAQSSRETRRNLATRGGDFGYDAITEQWHAERPKARTLTLNPALRD
jgi:IS30 family transposase